MDCPAFVGLDLRTSAIIIAVVGMLHWIACAVPVRRFRSEFFVALYVLAAAAGVVSCLLLAAVLMLHWIACAAPARIFRSEVFVALCMPTAASGCVSCLLFVGILTSMIVLYWVWIVFTLVYVAMMVVALLVMLIGFNTLRMRGVALMPLVALLYYILTLYFICVVNTHRQETQRAGWVLAGPGAGREGSGASNASTEALRDPTATTAVTMPTTSVPRRGRCVIPSVNPAHGAYYGVLPNKKFAQPDHSYPRLRLWVTCDQYHRARHLRYALCYSGGWNLPLPDCVRDKSFYEVYYYHDDYEDSAEAAPKGVCVLPRPPDHGYFTHDAEISKTHMALAVRCKPLHFLVGWQRLTCHDGRWNRPMPKCMFLDMTVCTLLKRTDGMVRTCLASEHYDATYQCDSGVVPHGAAVEPRCRRDHFVWGPFRYMHCIDGEWHPRDVSWHNISCQYATDIYRHYEFEEQKTSTTPGEPMRIGDNTTITYATDTFGKSIQDDDWAEISPQMEEFLTRNFTKMSIWKRQNKTKQSNTKINIPGLWKAHNERERTSDTNITSNSTGNLTENANKPLSTKSANKKLRTPQIDKAQGNSLTNSTKNDNLQFHGHANESMDDDSIRTNFWKLQKEALKAEAISTKPANKKLRTPQIHDARDESFINSIKNGISQSHRQANELLEDDSIRTNFWKLQKEALKADATGTKSANKKLRTSQIDKARDESFINSIKNDILQSHRLADESLEDDSIRTNFWKLQKEALRADATGTKSANKKLRTPQIDKAREESFINSSKNDIFQSHRQANESLDDDSIRTNFWKLQKYALKADATGTKLYNKKLRKSQTDKAQEEPFINTTETDIFQSHGHGNASLDNDSTQPQGESFINSIKNDIMQSHRQANESLHDDSIRTNFWKLQKEALKAEAIGNKSANKKLRNLQIDKTRNESFINSSKNYILQSHRQANESLDDDSIRSNFWKLKKYALKAEATGTNSANKKLRTPQIDNVQGEPFRNTTKTDILQSHRQANDSLEDDSNRTNFWKLQKEAIKANAIATKSDNKKLRTPQIDKAREESFINSIKNDIMQSHRQANESMDDDSIRSYFWELQKEALKADATGTKSANKKFTKSQTGKALGVPFVNSNKNDILQSKKQTNESLDDDSIRTNFWKLQKEALKTDATGTKSTNKNIRKSQTDKAKGKPFINSIKNDILQSNRQPNESLDDDSIRTNFWNLQKEALKANVFDTSLWKNQGHAGTSINKADKTKIRNTRNEIGEKPITNTNKTYLWTSRTENHSELRAKINPISIWKSESENNSEIFNAKSTKISIWKPQSQTSGPSSTSSYELSIWKSQSEDFGKRLIVNTSKVSIWKTDNTPSASLDMDWRKNNIRKSQEDLDKLVYPNLHKIKSKHFRKKTSKWLGMHSGRLRRGR